MARPVASRRRLWGGIVLVALAPLLAAAGAIADAVEAPLRITAALFAAGGLLLAGLEAYPRWREHRRERSAVARELHGLLRTGTPLPRIRKVDPYGHLGVFRSTLAERATPEGEHPAYVERDGDERLHALLTDASVAMVLLRGEACAGKKRSAYEALAACAPERPVLVPARPLTTDEVLGRLAELDLPLEGGEPPVLWLDNADWWADAGDLDLAVLQRLRTRHPGLLVVATLRYRAVPDQASARPSGAHEARRARAGDRVWLDLEAQPWFAQHFVPSGASGRELEGARGRYPGYAGEIAQRGVGPFFAGLDQLRRKLREGAGHCPAGVAAVQAAADWRRSGLNRPAPAEVLRRLVTDLRGPLDDGEFEEGLAWATQPVDSGARLLESTEASEGLAYRVSDGIAGNLTPERGHPATELAVVSRVGAAAASVLGPDHPHTLTTRHNIASWTGQTGNPHDALRLHTELLPDLGRVLGPDHPLTLTTRNNIAHWTGETGNPHDALRLHTELLFDRQRVFGPDHPLTLATRNNIASWTGETGNPHDALRLHTELLPDRQRVLGPDHPHTLTTRNNIAGWTGETGNPRDTLRLHTELLPDRQRVLGPDHPLTLATRSNIAHWTGETGNPHDALRLFSELLPDRQRVLGPDHPLTLATRSNIAHWTGETGNPHDALRLHTELLPDLERTLGPDHPLTLAIRNNIAFWTARTGNPHDALDQYTNLLPEVQRTLGPDHLHTRAVAGAIERLRDELEGDG